MKWLLLVGGVITLMVVTALVAWAMTSNGSSPSDAGPAGNTAVSPATTPPTGASSAIPTPVADRVDVRYTSTCQAKTPQVFVIGDGTSMTKTGYRFIANMTFYNHGNVPALVLAKVTWHLVGGEDVSLTKIIKDLPPGRHQVVGFTKPASLDQVERMGAHQYGDKLCSATGTVTKHK